MARAARYKAWQSKTAGKKFYFHTISGNSKTIAPSQRYDTHREVIRACEQNWIAHAKAFGIYGKHTTVTFLAMHPVPYTQDSLKPTVKPPMIPNNKPSDIVTSKSKTLKSAKRPRGMTVRAKKGEDLRKLTAPQLLARANLKREPAVQRIIEGARIGDLANVPKTAAGKAIEKAVEKTIKPALAKSLAKTSAAYARTKATA